jgi:hypothetical protein
MKYIKLFEDFKVKNITIEDVMTCISSGGVLYATIVRNLTNNDPSEPLCPLSVDEDGLVTVEFEGNDYEVELKNIDKVEW